MTTSYDEKRREHGRQKKGISMLSSVRSPLCSLVAKSGTELLPPRLSAISPPHSSFTFPLISISILLSFLCLPLCSSLRSSLPLSYPVLNSLTQPPALFPSFPSLCQSSLYLSLLFLPTVSPPLPQACCIIQMCIFHFFSSLRQLEISIGGQKETERTV